MKLNLNKLLGDDELSLDQCLFIRNLITYSIKKNNSNNTSFQTPYEFIYNIKDDQTNGLNSYWFGFKDIERLRQHGYQRVMGKLIRYYSSSTRDEDIIKKVQIVMKEGTVDYNLSYGKEIVFGNNQTMPAPDYRFVKKQALFLALKLLKEAQK